MPGNLISRAVLCASTAAFLLGPAESPRKERVWRQSSFRDFTACTFGDGGANSYVSAHGRVHSINRWDLNSDGYLDLVFANTHPHAEKLDAVIYWGNGDNCDDSRGSFIATNGAQWLIPADVDRDGEVASHFRLNVA